MAHYNGFRSVGYAYSIWLHQSAYYPYRATDADSFGSIDVLFNRTIKTNLITEQWDQMLRVAASLKAGTVPTIR